MLMLSAATLSLLLALLLPLLPKLGKDVTS
jgi:hypothetical protein